MLNFFYLTESNDWLSQNYDTIIFNVLIAIIPSIILCSYVYYKDEVEKEPMKMLLSLFFLGVLITVPAAFMEQTLIQLFDLKDKVGLAEILVESFFVIALIEEGYKFLIIYFGCWKNKNFNHVYDGIVYATFVSLGFAALENILYVFSLGSQAALLRAFISVPAHAFYAISCGYYLGLSKLNYSIGNSKKGRMYKRLSFFVPVFMHGTFDFLLLLDRNELLWMFFAFVAILYIISFFNIRRLSSVQMTSSIQNRR